MKYMKCNPCQCLAASYRELLSSVNFVNAWNKLKTRNNRIQGRGRCRQRANEQKACGSSVFFCWAWKAPNTDEIGTCSVSRRQCRDLHLVYIKFFLMQIFLTRSTFRIISGLLSMLEDFEDTVPLLHKPNLALPCMVSHEKANAVSWGWEVQKRWIRSHMHGANPDCSSVFVL